MSELSLRRKRDELAKMVKDYQAKRDQEYRTHIDRFIRDNSPFNVGDVIKATGRITSKRMTVDKLVLHWINDRPVIIAYGRFIVGRRNRVGKYNEKGYGVYGITHLGLKIEKVKIATK